MRVAIIGGVRPHFIKIAALQNAINEYNSAFINTEKIDAVYINSGQHYDAELCSIIDELGVKFDCTLRQQDTDEIHIIGNIINDLYDTFKKYQKFDYVITIGDTTTTLATAVSAARLHYPVVHIEAGIRSGKLDSIEEAHRRMVDHVSSLHFCITKTGLKNLKLEGISDSAVWTGDLSYDFFKSYANKQANTFSNMKADSYILATMHKSRNFESDDVIRNVIYALSEYPCEVLFVMHPKTRKKLFELGLTKSPGIRFVESISYGEMLSAIKGCKFLFTDSGGLQKEALFLSKRCLVRQDNTGWVNLINTNIHSLTGRNKDEILRDLQKMERVASLSDGFLNAVNEYVRPSACNFALKTLVERFARSI